MKNLPDSNKAMLQTLLRLQKFTRHLNLTARPVPDKRPVFKTYLLRTVIVNERGKLMVIYKRVNTQ